MGSPSEADPAAPVRIRQQEVVAELGQQALETDDLDQLMHVASTAVAETLDNDYAKVLELLPGGDEVFLRHGVGWHDGIVGSATVPTELNSQAGYTLRTEEPVIVDDLQTEERFSGPELLTSHDVVSGISVVIGSVEEPWGVLGTHTTERREFNEHDATFVQSVANVLASAIENEAAHSELQETHERIASGILALDEAWEFTHVNQQAEETLGYDADELLGRNIWEAFPELADTEFEERYREAMATQEPTSFESYYPPFDAWFEEHAYPSETGLSVYFRDLTEQKQMEAEFEEVYGRISDAFFALDEEWKFTHLNDHAHKIIRPEGQELVGETIWEEFPAATERQFRPKYERAMYEQETVSFEEYYPEPLDAWFEVRAYPSETGLSVYFRDITEQVERERELERVHDLLEKTERIADVGGWEIDPTTLEVFWTDHIFELLEVDADEEPPLDEVLAMYHEEDQSVVEGAAKEALDTGAPFDIEARIRPRSGEIRWLRLQGIPKTVNGEIVSLRGAVQDITDRKRREQRFGELIDRLEESNERLEQFAYAASHDLQEPLRMVSSYLQLIERQYSDELDEDAEEFIEFAVDGAERMRAMIDGLLEYSRVEMQGDPFEPVDLDAVLADVREDLQVKFEENDAELTAEELPRIEGDADQLRQVFQNLLANAIEYSGDEPPRIHVTAERDGAEWVLAVQDEGVGVDPDHADRIFQVFERLHGNDEHSGTGIGLALCERIVERHGGDIWIDSRPGEGATFSFTLPAASGRDT